MRGVLVNRGCCRSCEKVEEDEENNYSCLITIGLVRQKCNRYPRHKVSKLMYMGISADIFRNFRIRPEMSAGLQWSHSYKAHTNSRKNLVAVVIRWKAPFIQYESIQTNEFEFLRGVCHTKPNYGHKYEGVQAMIWIKPFFITILLLLHHKP